MNLFLKVGLKNILFNDVVSNSVKNLLNDSFNELIVYKGYSLARPKQNICFQRLQIYLLPEMASKLQSDALSKHIKISKHIRNLLNQLLTSNPKGNDINE